MLINYSGNDYHSIHIRRLFYDEKKYVTSLILSKNVTRYSYL